MAKQERKTVAERGDVRCSERRQEFSSKQQKKNRMQRHKRQQHCWREDTAEKRRRRRDHIHCDLEECDIIVLKWPCRGVGTWSMWLQMGRTHDLRIMETRRSRAVDDTPRPYIHGSLEDSQTNTELGNCWTTNWTDFISERAIALSITVNNQPVLLMSVYTPTRDTQITTLKRHTEQSRNTPNQRSTFKSWAETSTLS